MVGLLYTSSVCPTDERFGIVRLLGCNPCAEAINVPTATGWEHTKLFWGDEAFPVFIPAAKKICRAVAESETEAD
jgi:hypothetical protein